MSLQQRAVIAAVVGVLSATFSVGFVAPALASPVTASPVTTSPSAAAPVAPAFAVTSAPVVVPTEPRADVVEARSADAPSEEADKGSMLVEPALGDVSGTEDAHTLTPVILVAGLAVLFAAILMVVRSGSSKELDPEQISPLTDRS